MKTNKGKKYIKLRGVEVPTRTNETYARHFMEWYAENMNRIRRYAGGLGVPVDEDLLTDTMIGIYEGIAYKGLRIVNYTAYFLRAYRSRFINQEKKNAAVSHVEVSDVVDMPDSGFNSGLYENIVSEFNSEVMEYVRANYDEISVSLFEMYVGLAPDISYKKLSALLGISFVKVYTSIGNIKKSIVKEFGPKRDFIRSIVDF